MLSTAVVGRETTWRKGYVACSFPLVFPALGTNVAPRQRFNKKECKDTDDLPFGLATWEPSMLVVRLSRWTLVLWITIANLDRWKDGELVTQNMFKLVGKQLFGEGLHWKHSCFLVNGFQVQKSIRNVSTEASVARLYCLEITITTQYGARVPLVSPEKKSEKYKRPVLVLKFDKICEE